LIINLFLPELQSLGFMAAVLRITLDGKAPSLASGAVRLLVKGGLQGKLGGLGRVSIKAGSL
jgi:hypothetical protein